MSKISPIQAAALGINVAKPTEKTTPAATGAAKPAPSKTPVKKAVVKKPIVKKPPVAKPAVAKPVAAKPIAKAPAAKSAVKVNPLTKAKPASGKPASSKPATKAKPQKVKMERDSFTMPKEEYAQLPLLKARLAALGQPAKKSELLRAGIKLLVAMSDNTLKMTMAKIPVIKTGRPKKK